MKKYIEYKLTATKFEEPPARILNTNQVVDLCRNFYKDDILIQENMFMIALNRANRPIAHFHISKGGITGTICDPLLIAKYAIDSLAKAVILVHNHPSGNTFPSEVDKKLTQKIRQGLNLFDILLMDHIILTDTEHHSMQESGNL